MLAIYTVSTGYRILGLLHIFAAIVAFGPMIVYPTLRRGDSARLAKLHLYLILPALTLVWALGMGLVGMSDDLWEMSQTWIVLALVGWVVLMAVSWFLIRPAITDAGSDADKKFSAGVGITHLVSVAVLVLMIFKPGTGGL